MCGKKGASSTVKKTKEGERMEQFKVFITRSARKIVCRKKREGIKCTPLSSVFLYSPPIYIYIKMG
jgi:hypothetical protein